MIYAGFPPVLCVRAEDGHVPTFLFLLLVPVLGLYYVVYITSYTL